MPDTVRSRPDATPPDSTRWRVPVPVLAVILLVLIGASFIISLTFGSVEYSRAQVWEVVFARLSGGEGPTKAIDSIVWELRVPRGILAIIVGAGLAIAGVVMQTLVRNPLADPYLLGISAGASVGATAVITMGMFAAFGVWALSGGALIGALVATTTVYAVTMAQGGITPLRLILSGVVLSAAFSALASFLVFKAPDARAAQSVLFWMLGSVAGAQWNKLLIPAVVVIVGLIVAIAMSNPMDALASGPDTAAALGVRVGVLRQGLFVFQALLIGVLVAVSGGIGFVGLVIPHMARIMVGSLHRRLLPIAALFGAVFLLWVDVLARVLAPPQEIPLGVVTGIIGAPIFLILMGRGRTSYGSNS